MLVMEFFVIFLMWWMLCVATASSTADLAGHLQELGKHRNPIGHIKIVETLPSPKEFWERYASQRHPVLFKGAARRFKAMNLWTDEYLLKHYGDLKVKVESKAEKDEIPTGIKGLGQDTIKNFLASYQSKNTYIVSQLPNTMAREVSVLPFLTCGTFGERILEANLWMSSGGTKSLLHRDADNAVNCLLTVLQSEIGQWYHLANIPTLGRKDWILIHPAFEDRIPIAKEAVEAYGGFSLLDPDKVNLKKYPAFADVEWSYANVTAGDCLFLPYGYWHQVRSFDRNLAVSVLFSRLTEVDLSSCHDKDLQYTPLSEVNMVYTYDGYSDQTMGDTDPFELNETLTEWCDTSKMLKSSDILAHLLETYGLDSENLMPNAIPNQHSKLDERHTLKETLKEATEKMMRLLDTDNNGRISCKTELSGLPLNTLRTVANILDGDTANTEHHEFISFSPQQIRDFLAECMEWADHHSNGELSSQDFLEFYLAFGGSIQGGQEVFSVIDDENNGFISKEEFHTNVERVLLMYSKTAKPDSSNMLWEKAKRENLGEQLDNHLRQDQDDWRKHLYDDL